MAETSFSPRVLVVDDEPSIVDVLSRILRRNGFAVTAAASAGQALIEIGERKPDLVLLDVMLPDMDGFEVARRLGEGRSGTPIIFLTARDDTAAKVNGLSLGGEDYITKPFSVDELLARVRTVLRRTDVAATGSPVLRFEDLVLDEAAHEVGRGSRAIELTVTEFKLLRYLMLNPRRVLTRRQLLEEVWGYDFGGDGRVLETYVSYLRKKLDAHGPSLIHTVRGVGYILRSPRV